MNIGVVVAVVTGLFSLTGTIITAGFGLVAARKARDAERARMREAKERENAINLAEIYGDALKAEREESARLRAELRQRPPRRTEQ